MLSRFGYDEARLRGVRCDSVELRAPDGSTLSTASMDFVPKVYGAPWYLCHRVDLHNELERLAFDAAGEGTPAKLHLRSKVASVDCEGGEITLASGEVFKGDLVVGADGVHSMVRTHVLGAADISPSPSGHSAYRFLVPVSRIAADPMLAKYVPSASKPTMIIVSSAEKGLVLYPCRDSTILNVVAHHADHLSQRNSERADWNAKTRSVDELKQTYADFAPELHRLFELADDIKMWTLLDSGALETWIKGRTCLLGDACHPMLPYQAQGGAQAIEDAAALGVIFGGGVAVTAADVPARLRYYEFVRKSRAEATQKFSRAQSVKESPPPADPKAARDAVQKFLFSHDVVAYATQALSALFIPSTIVADGAPPPANGTASIDGGDK